MESDHYVLAFVMAGGRGSRLKVLTKSRSKPAVGILGQYRIIDFVATNITNSGIPVMLAATQFEPSSLSKHIGKAAIWGFDMIDRSLEIIHPHQKNDKLVTFGGTADSVRKSIDRIERYAPGIVLVLGGDHVYTMNYSNAIAEHITNQADMTIMTNVVTESKVQDLGIVKIDDNCRIVDFAEKPENKALIERFRLPPKVKERLGINDPDLSFLASMGNYIFFWDRLRKFLEFPGMDFGNDLIPAIRENSQKIYAHIFNGYWRDVGLIKDYFQCNLEFAGDRPPVDLIKNRIRTYHRYLPGPWIAGDAYVQGAILSPGDIIQRKSVVTSCVLGYQTFIGERCKLDRCVILGADRNEFHDNQLRREYTTRIGAGSNLSYTILDKNVWIGRNVDIGPHNGSPEERSRVLKNVGLKPYRELPDGIFEGDFCIDPETNILVIGKQSGEDPKEPILPDGLRC